MNVLFFTLWYPTKENPSKGIFIKEHAIAIKSANPSLIVLAININADKKILGIKNEVVIENGLETHVININSILYKFIYSLPIITYWFAINYIKKNLNYKFDLIHSNILFPTAIIGNRLASKLKTKHLITEHWSKIDSFIHKHPFGFLGRKTLNKANYITSVSLYLKKNIEKYIYKKNNISIEVIPNVVNREIFNYQEKSKTNNLIFTATANWKAPKLPHLFIEALNNIQKNYINDLTLNIIGEGELLNEIKNNLQKFKIKINFLGNKNKYEISEILKQSDFFVHASSIETFSVVIAEALVSGIPVIASEVGAIPELVSENHGVTTKNTIQDWEIAIEKAIKSYYNQKDISIENSNKFDQLKIGQIFKNLYEKL